MLPCFFLSLSLSREKKRGVIQRCYAFCRQRVERDASKYKHSARTRRFFHYFRERARGDTDSFSLSREKKSVKIIYSRLEIITIHIYIYSKKLSLKKKSPNLNDTLSCGNSRDIYLLFTLVPIIKRREKRIHIKARNSYTYIRLYACTDRS